MFVIYRCLNVSDEQHWEYALYWLVSVIKIFSIETCHLNHIHTWFSIICFFKFVCPIFKMTKSKFLILAPNQWKSDGPPTVISFNEMIILLRILNITRRYGVNHNGWKLNSNFSRLFVSNDSLEVVEMLKFENRTVTNSF